MKKFSFDKLTSELSKEFKDVFKENEIRELLELGESYSKDSPISTGKSLSLSHIAFRGVKKLSDQSDEKIDYYQEIKEGINIWIADNNKGKSSILKVIKYVLTGKSSLKTDVESWIDTILLGFKIGNKNYTAFLDATGTRLKSKVFSTKLMTWEELENTSKEPMFETKTKKDYIEQIESFFFNQFSYYSLRWTQKSPVKTKNELIEVGASWKTYFKSIYLESRDSYDLIFGDQGKKIFQMLLGLELTYPINQLAIKRDFISDKKGKAKLVSEINLKEIQKNKKQLEIDLQSVKKEIKDFNNRILAKSSVDISALSKQYNLLQSKSNKILEKRTLLDKKANSLRRKISSIKKEQTTIDEGLGSIKSNIQKNGKRVLELEEYLEIGIFFSNLDIKSCPSCNHSIKDEKKKINLAAHKCALCDESVSDTEHQLDVTDYKQKIKDLKNSSTQLEISKSKLKQQRENLNTEYVNVYDKSIAVEQEKESLDNIEDISLQMKAIDETIKKEVNKSTYNPKEKDKLIAKKAVIEYKLGKLEGTSSKTNSNSFDNKINLLNVAIDKLLATRYAIGKNILERLQEIMLKEIRVFGLTSITEVKISEKFDIRYKQNGSFIAFNEITEGEQLRAKIAFYLSLIQLDIELNSGRHTRFLMIDSPSKEEGDAKYLEGLSIVLKSIQDRFGEELQILIGTAERGFTDVVENQYIKPTETFVF